MSNISCIPPEILSEIFIRCLPADSASQGTQQLLRNVCRLWRALVLVTPALWASLDITCYPFATRPPLPIIHTHLQRSGTHPLSFMLYATGLEINPSLLSVLTALAAARQRWRSVHAKLVSITQEILDLITLGDAPLLQSLHCNIVTTKAIRGLPIPLRMLRGCPRLESFQWTSFNSPLLLPLGDTRLTSLSLWTTLSVSECVTILRLSPHLSSARFKSFSIADPSPVPHLTHPILRTLTAMGEYSSSLLAALTLPALLDLDLAIGHTGWDIPLSAFLTRRNPTLRKLSLSITHRYSAGPTLLRILTLTPHLRGLRIINCCRDTLPFTATALIRALHPPPPPGAPLCPRLRDLDISGISSCPDGLCAAMLRARWGAHAEANGVACLKRGHIRLEGGRHERDQAEMKELCAEGMQGTIYSRHRYGG